MPRILLNALASTAGGGITYLENVLPRLEQGIQENQYIVLVPPERFRGCVRFESERVKVETRASAGGAMGRMLLEQTWLRSFIKKRKVDVLISLGNFALLRSPVPQILFNRNDLYFSPEFERDLKSRKQGLALAAHRLKAHLARVSIQQAQINVTPTAAFAKKIHGYDGLSAPQFEVLHFGFDAEIFTAGQEPLPATSTTKLKLRENCRRLLYVSHYNYYRNFETLIRALPAVKSELKRQTGEDLQLVLTTDIQRGAVYGGYDATAAAELIERLGVREDIAMLGAVEYGKLHQIYRLCDAFVCPSYSESFGHPLLEAMASGAPVVAARLPVHQEVCGEAAVYFEVFDEAELARQCVRVLTDPVLSERLRAKGLERSRQFSWSEHVRGLEELIGRAVRQSAIQ